MNGFGIKILREENAETIAFAIELIILWFFKIFIVMGLPQVFILFSYLQWMQLNFLLFE